MGKMLEARTTPAGEEGKEKKGERGRSDAAPCAPLPAPHLAAPPTSYVILPLRLCSGLFYCCLILSPVFKISLFLGLIPSPSLSFSFFLGLFFSLPEYLFPSLFIEITLPVFLPTSPWILSLSHPSLPLVCEFLSPYPANHLLPLSTPLPFSASLHLSFSLSLSLSTFLPPSSSSLFCQAESTSEFLFPSSPPAPPPSFYCLASSIFLGLSPLSPLIFWASYVFIGFPPTPRFFCLASSIFLVPAPNFFCLASPIFLGLSPVFFFCLTSSVFLGLSPLHPAPFFAWPPLASWISPLL